jgi:hypothetical protein
MCFVAASRSRLIEMLRILHYITPSFCRNRAAGLDFWQKTAQKTMNGGELDVEGAAGHPRSRDGAGRSERRLARSTAREVEKSDREVRFSARPSLPELEVALPSRHSTSVVSSCGIPRSERGTSRLPLVHCHHHTPQFVHCTTRTRVLSVSGRWSSPKTESRFDENTIHLLFCFLGRSRYVAPAE